jgi:hypothetical protein
MKMHLAALTVLAACQGSLAPPGSSGPPPTVDDAAFSVDFPPSDPELADPDAGENTVSVVPPATQAQPPPTVEETTPDPDASIAETSTPPIDTVDASLAIDAGDAAEEGACTAPLAPGDLAIDELMVESVAGAGDDGEWIEVHSLLSCTVDLAGLHGECARGANVIAFDVTSDFFVPPGGFVLIADSAASAVNPYLPSPLVVWSGHAGDVLRNKGATVSLLMNEVLIDSITYPALKLTAGVSWAFPSDCDPSLRADLAHWLPSTESWFPGFLGTPGASNDDVHCP